MGASAYILRRLVTMIPVLILLSMVVFALTRLAGDPAAMYIVPGMSPEQIARIREAYHLNDPIHLQYLSYVKGLLKGDLGYSRVAGMPVSRAISTYLPATFELTAFSMLIAIPLAIKIGSFSAVRRGSVADQLGRVIALGGVSVPIFWLALILLWLFYAELRVLPVGRFDPYIWPLTQRPTNFYVLDAVINGSGAQLIDAFRHLFLPGLCLGYLELALIMRIMRSSMLEVLREDYITTARAKGLAERIVIKKHARRNAMLPTTTVIGFSLGTMLTGSILTEKVFNWPGMGFWAMRSILNLDTTSIMGYVMLTGIIFILANLITDIIYAYLDPRISVD